VKNLVIIGSAFVIVAGLSTKKPDKLAAVVAKKKESVNS
jgi:hypothetical protein